VLNNFNQPLRDRRIDLYDEMLGASIKRGTISARCWHTQQALNAKARPGVARRGFIKQSCSRSGCRGYAFTLAASPATARTDVWLLSVAGSVDWRAAATGDPAYLSKWQQLR
jgi:hypothetical protein